GFGNGGGGGVGWGSCRGLDLRLLFFGDDDAALRFFQEHESKTFFWRGMRAPRGPAASWTWVSHRASFWHRGPVSCKSDFSAVLSLNLSIAGERARSDKLI